MTLTHIGIDKTCTQEDFLCIASVIGSVHIDTADLTECLGVSFEGRDVAEGNENLIVQALLLWKSKNSANCTRANLLHNLQKLEHTSVSSCIDKIRERYSECIIIHHSISQSCFINYITYYHNHPKLQ